MEKLEAAGRSTLRLAWLGAAAAVALLLLLLAHTERERREAHRQAMRAEVQDSADLLAAGLQGVIDRNIQLVQGLVAVVSFEPGMDQERFARLGAQVLQRRERDRQHRRGARTWSSGACIRSRATRRCSGSTTATCRTSCRDVLRARDLGVTVLAGPVDLVQGGQAASSRARRSSSTTAPARSRGSGGSSRR